MKAARLSAAPILLHAIAAVLFVLTAGALLREAAALEGRTRALGLACAAGALGVAAVAAASARAFSMNRVAVQVRARAGASVYVQVLLAAAMSAGAGMRLWTAGRPAFVFFAALLALYLIAAGLHLTSGVRISERALVDPYGRSTPLAALEWFRLREDAPQRATLEAGTGDALLFAARVDARQRERISEALSRAGLRPLADR